MSQGPFFPCCDNTRHSQEVCNCAGLVPITLSMWCAQTAATWQPSLQGPDWKDIPSKQKLLASNRPSSADGVSESNFLWRPDAAECAMDSEERAESSRCPLCHLSQFLACSTVVIYRHSSHNHSSATASLAHLVSVW